MSVCYVYQDEYPWDIRVDKITGSLSAAGISTTILCRNRHRLKRYEMVSANLAIRRLPKGLTSLDRTLLNFPAFFSPTWITELLVCVRQNGIRLIIVRDLPLSPTAILVGRLVGIPVVMDMAENYAAMIRDTWQYRGPGPFDLILRNPRALGRLEKAVLPGLAGVLVVSESSAQRIRGMTGAKITVVGNTPRIDNRAALSDHPRVKTMSARTGMKMLYVGGLEESRGLDVVIKALALLPKETSLTIVGKGTGESSLRQLARDLSVTGQLDFAGWVDQQHISAFIRAADVCLVPHYRTEHTDTTMPNKIYDYMAQAKPVVVTDATALRMLVEETLCGIHYRDRYPEELAECLRSLEDSELRRQLGANGQAAIHSRYNWEQDEKALIQAIESAYKHDGRQA